MDKLQKLQKAKFYLQMLACSMDPTTQEFIESELLSKKEIKEVFEFVSSILDDLINNDGEVVNVTKPISFQPSRLNKQKIVLSNEPILLSSLATRINKQVDTETMQKLGVSKISNWLVSQGYLEKQKVSVVKEISQLALGEKAESFGIVSMEKVDRKTGELKPCILFNRQAQEYIVNNLETILGEENDEGESFDDEKADYSMVGKPWSKEEDERLVKEYTEQKLKVQEIASLHKRKCMGIRVRLKFLGLTKY